MLSVLQGCEKCHPYMFGIEKILETHHKPLVAIFKENIDLCPLSYQHMVIPLQKYDFELIYKKSKELYISMGRK